MTPKKSQSAIPSPMSTTLHLFGLISVVIALPIYSFLSANPAYILTNGIQPKTVYGLIALLSILLPATISTTILLIYKINKRLHWKLHLAVMSILLALYILPLASNMDINNLDIIPVGINVLFVALITAIAIYKYATKRIADDILALSAILTIAFPVHFVSDHNISQLLNPQTQTTGHWQPKDSQTPPSILLIVFDEFPLISILDAHGNIDQKRFPNFSEFAQQSTWYPNATTVSDFTLKAIPAILTGRFPIPGGAMPIAENYPNTLFDILGSHYKIHSLEEVTNLAPHNQDDPHPKPHPNLTLVSADLLIVYLRSLLPKKTAQRWLPIEDGIWGGFLKHIPFLRHETTRFVLEWEQDRLEELDGINLIDLAKQYADDIEQYPPTTFHFIHLLLPHQPFQFLPSGRYYPEPIFAGNRVDEAQHRAYKKHRYQAHILQVGAVDTLFGYFTEKLHRLKIFDDALIIITADHGMSFVENESERILTDKNFGSVGFIPLFIKYPNQKKRAINNANARNTDIVPTILDTLNIDLPTTLDGHSLIESNANMPKSKKIMSRDDTIFEFTQDQYTKLRKTAHQSAIDFFALNEPRSTLFNFTKSIGFLGLNTNDITNVEIPCTIECDGLKDLQMIDQASPRILSRLKGTITFPKNTAPQNPILAISVNGKIEALDEPTIIMGKMRFHVIIPDDIFLHGKNEVTLHLLDSKDAPP